MTGKGRSIRSRPDPSPISSFPVSLLACLLLLLIILVLPPWIYGLPVCPTGAPLRPRVILCRIVHCHSRPQHLPTYLRYPIPLCVCSVLRRPYASISVQKYACMYCMHICCIQCRSVYDSRTASQQSTGDTSSFSPFLSRTPPARGASRPALWRRGKRKSRGRYLMMPLSV